MPTHIDNCLFEQLSMLVQRWLGLASQDSDSV